jgi:hypothetical protein
MALVTLKKQPSPKKSQLKGIRSLNKMQQGIIRIMTQYVDGSPIEPKCVFFEMAKQLRCCCEKECKIISSRDNVLKDMQETLWGFIK